MTMRTRHSWKKNDLKKRNKNETQITLLWSFGSYSSWRKFYIFLRKAKIFWGGTYLLTEEIENYYPLQVSNDNFPINVKNFQLKYVSRRKPVRILNGFKMAKF